MAENLISLADLGAALAGLGALSTAAFGLLDSTKAFWGGASNIGCGHIRGALTPFAPALDNALGADGWWPVVRAHWVSGAEHGQAGPAGLHRRGRGRRRLPWPANTCGPN